MRSIKITVRLPPRTEWTKSKNAFIVNLPKFVLTRIEIAYCVRWDLNKKINEKIFWNGTKISTKISLHSKMMTEAISKKFFSLPANEKEWNAASRCGLCSSIINNKTQKNCNIYNWLHFLLSFGLFHLMCERLCVCVCASWGFDYSLNSFLLSWKHFFFFVRCFSYCFLPARKKKWCFDYKSTHSIWFDLS